MIFTSSYKIVGDLEDLGWERRKIYGVSVSEVDSVVNYVDCFKPNWNLVKLYKRYCHGSPSEVRDIIQYYERWYNYQLSHLNADYLAKELDDCVLLCFESSGEFCHRHLIRRWFNYHHHNCIEFWVN